MLTVRPEYITEIQTATDKYRMQAGAVSVEELSFAWTDDGTPHEAPLVSTRYGFTFLDTSLGPSEVVVIPVESVVSLRTIRPRAEDEEG